MEGVEGDGEGEDVGQRPAEVEHEVELGDRDQQKPTQDKNGVCQERSSENG